MLLDGRPREEHGRAVLCNSIAMVDQDIALFDGTIRENITMWDDGMGRCPGGEGGEGCLYP